MLLELDGDLELPKETYIKVDLPYMIPLSMLKANCRDLRSGKILKLKPRSFAKLLQYVESRLATEPKLLRKTIASRRVTHRGSRHAQGLNTPKLAPTMRNVLMVFVMMMIVIYIALAYLRGLLDRTTHRMRETMMQIRLHDPFCGLWKLVDLGSNSWTCSFRGRKPAVSDISDAD